MKGTRKGKRTGKTGISNKRTRKRARKRTRTRKRTRKRKTMAHSNRKTLLKMSGNLSDLIRIICKIVSENG